MQILEIKEHLDGRTQQFECELIKLSENHAIVSYVWDRKTPYQDGPAFLPAQPIHTKAYYWSDRNYLIYHLTSASGELFGYRIDACEDVRISKAEIRWRDLILDFWIDPNKNLHVLDKSELIVARNNGVMTTTQFNKALNVEQVLMDHYTTLLNEL